MTPEMQKALEAPFDTSFIQRKGNYTYISHGLITERLNDVDPEWSSEVVRTHTYTDANGILHCAGVELALTVGGVTRVEAGGPQRTESFNNEIKNSYSTALKRAAMRFGVALAMWESMVDALGDEDIDPDYAQQATQSHQAAATPHNRTQSVQRQPSAPQRPPQAQQTAPLDNPDDVAAMLDEIGAIGRVYGMEMPDIRVFAAEKGRKDIRRMKPLAQWPLESLKRLRDTLETEGESWAPPQAPQGPYADLEPGLPGMPPPAPPQTDYTR